MNLLKFHFHYVTSKSLYCQDAGQGRQTFARRRIICNACIFPNEAPLGCVSADTAMVLQR